MNKVSDADATIGVRWPELIVALTLVAAALLVIVDSLRVGTGWGDDGPRSGYFPFYIGLGLLGSGAWISLQQLLHWRRPGEFAQRAQIALVVAVGVPMVFYVGAVEWLGLYVGSALLIAYFMLRHGKHRAALTAAVAAGVPVVCYLVFERWFLVPLPKGPLEHLLGL